MNHRQNHLFRGDEIYVVVEHAKARVVQKIESEDPDYLLKVSEQDYITHIVESFQMSVPVLLEDQIEAETPQETMVDVSDRFEYASWGQHLEVPGSETTIVVPFEGDPAFFSIKPSAFTSSGVRATVSGNELRFSFVQIKGDATKLRTELEQQLKMTRENLRFLKESVGQYHGILPGLVAEKVSQRKARLLDSRGMAAHLGFRVRRREGTSDIYKVPVERKKVVAAPKVPKGNFQPEPVLDDATYQEILGLIENMTRVMEYSPGAFATMGEEDLRTHFLVQLNGQFQGTASGETFNYEGKTDILIRADGRNVFIAECKFWGGPKAFLDAIDQLMGYLSWHDTKCAVMMFNRNVNFSAVLKSIVEAVPQHPNFKRDLGKRSDTSFKYIFGHPEDINRELIVTVMAFNIPDKKVVP